MAAAQARPLRFSILARAMAGFAIVLCTGPQSCGTRHTQRQCGRTGAAAEFLRNAPGLFECIVASFDDIPLESGRFDIALFNASLHYAQNLTCVLQEAVRVTRPGGTIVILDSPFYVRDEDGAAMVAEKHAQGQARFGARADVLLAQNFIEYLTHERLAAAAPDLVWSRRRVRYPLWYEMRPLLAWLKKKRAPSRFDLWTAGAP